MKNDLLPGAELRLVERGGSLEIDFVATDPESAAWLAAQAGTLAAEISRRLRRDVRVSVRKDDYDGEPIARSDGAEPRPALDGPAALFAHRLVDENGRKAANREARAPAEAHARGARLTATPSPRRPTP
jgi:hypothetical protein